MIDLKGKSAVVTGSARGIGKSTALTLAKAGANIVIADLNEESSKATADEIAKQTGVKAIGIGTNVADADSAAKAIQACVDTFGSVDILVNNAGITKDTLLMRMKKEQWDAVIAVNLTGTYNCTQAAIKFMMKNPNGGSIINLSSIAGVNGNIGQTNYSASKAGVIGFTKAVALEMASRKVRCNAIAPGFIATEMTDAIPEKIKTAMIAAIPLKRAGQPEDIANTIAFLASDISSFITGQVIEVNGGGFLPGVQA
ncbi:3-oxoacyl-[acyl-carrier-protein] reductase [Leptospira weilii serovar Topaz str. LT2116]|uniref:3-oxoacyl-[acyl-carrier-protein] reductase n=2 Tax=Leptospira TaxID=171 RepID=M3FK26_9LEPT|nr:MULTISPECIES: 3-oxoacyl-[acyl-carrier-protein] reductase [Leptospira]EMF80767.1 3-oxoacyl-[acyl-carrier-protein] reductase [Leptospira weilii serovar Topaz str. LT2116]EQA62836.1 3-oxoacyl-[acyl-carrier-protein] reductase [Leptospira alexanderi serovar Manhao 3 str. L 60]ULH27862.1 3-oxoacyl-[acyl-carrier-protein] reductase [Leptospira weilii]UPY77104.1 3-oxoacyl-[acyl-carrier-protein] reductase [Leptospira weilii]